MPRTFKDKHGLTTVSAYVCTQKGAMPQLPAEMTQ